VDLQQVHGASVFLQQTWAKLPFPPSNRQCPTIIAVSRQTRSKLVSILYSNLTFSFWHYSNVFPATEILTSEALARVRKLTLGKIHLHHASKEKRLQAQHRIAETLVRFTNLKYVYLGWFNRYYIPALIHGNARNYRLAGDEPWDPETLISVAILYAACPRLTEGGGWCRTVLEDGERPERERVEVLLSCNGQGRDPQGFVRLPDITEEIRRWESYRSEHEVKTFDLNEYLPATIPNWSFQK
jgi:hypothetical protein